MLDMTMGQINGWYVGDFNGDGKDDIFRYCPSNRPCGSVKSGAEVFLSTGTGFVRAAWSPPVLRTSKHKSLTKSLDYI
jgi:hypothetical protein